jgi:hypothetical protein
MKRRRAGVAVTVGLCGIAIVAGAKVGWVGARGTRPASGITGTSITGLLTWSYHATASFVSSFALVVIVAGVLVFLGGLLASRLLAALFAFVALAAAGLWIGLNASHYNAVNLPASDLRAGAWLTVAGGLIALISSAFLRPRRG